MKIRSPIRLVRASMDNLSVARKRKPRRGGKAGDSCRTAPGLFPCFRVLIESPGLIKTALFAFSGARAKSVQTVCFGALKQEVRALKRTEIFSTERAVERKTSGFSAENEEKQRKCHFLNTRAASVLVSPQDVRLS
jgi:hypothetical protein